MQPIKTYCKISIVSPELIFVQKAFLVGLFVGELIFRGVITGENVNSLKQLTLAVHGLIYRGMLIIGRIFASEIWGGGGGFGRWGGGGLLSEFYSISLNTSVFQIAVYHIREGGRIQKNFCNLTLVCALWSHNVLSFPKLLFLFASGYTGMCTILYFFLSHGKSYLY